MKAGTGDFEVLIVGGGPVGATVAALLARSGALPAARVALLAPDIAASEQPLDEMALCDLRVSALARAAQTVLRQAGAWDGMPQRRLCAYERMRVWHESLPPDGAGTLVFDAAELAEPELGVMVENRALTRASLHSFRTAGGAVIAASLNALTMEPSQVVCSTNSGECTARLIVGADGARSQVREQLGLPTRSHAYGQSAIIATIATEKPHQHTAWQRFLSTGPLALLPLFDGNCSIVWSADDRLAKELMALSPAEFAVRLDTASDRVLGHTMLRSVRAALPLARITAQQLIAPRAALIGDAAHQIHPLAGQGVNLGFLDAAALSAAVSQALGEGEDPGTLRALRRYEQQRLTHNTLMSVSMSAFNAIFSQGSVAGWLGARLLAAAGSSTTARRLLARRAMGLDQSMPRHAAGTRA
jgi:2-polyprenylphenol 6-hydroxylase